MHRRTLLVAGLASLTASRVLAQTQLPPARARDDSGVLDRPEPIGDPNAMPGVAKTPEYPTPSDRGNAAAPPRGYRDPANRPPSRVETYSQDELVSNVSDFLGVTAEAAGGAIERIFSQNQDRRPTGYIAGEEGAVAIFAGVRYGRGLLYMKNREPVTVYWQGPSIGWDLGGNASRVFTLCYDLEDPTTIFQRFPGVEGSAYVIGGLGVNYQRADRVTLAPIRAGVGLRLGANVGYLSYTRQRNPFPF